MQTTSKGTIDPEANLINQQLNDVERAAQVGEQLQQILTGRFNNNTKAFRQWVKHHIDRDYLSIVRYIVLHQHSATLQKFGFIRLKQAYQYLGIDGTQISLDDAADQD